MRDRSITIALGALLATTMLSAPLHAVTPVGIPPVHQSIDSNGVDMALGKFQMSVPLLSIGPGNHHGLTLSRGGSMGQWRENLTATMAHDASGKTVVSIGMASNSFTSSGGTYINNQANGATLVYGSGVYTYTTSDGTVAVFPPANGQYDRFVADIGWLRDITFPDGTKWTYQYLGRNYCPHELDPEFPTCTLPLARSVRLQSVNSSTGYQMKFSYQSNILTDVTELDAWNNLTRVRAINNAVDYVDPVADIYTTTKTWPSVQFGGSGNETFTDASGAVTTFSVSGTSMTIRRPGATVDDVAVTYSGSKVSNVTKAGVGYNYAWTDNGNTRTMVRTGPLSSSLTVTSDIDTSLIRTVKDALNRTTSYDYDSNGRLTKITAPEGNYTLLTYDPRGNVTETKNVAKPGSGLVDIISSASFDASCSNPKTCNKPNTTTDARGKVTNYSYNATHGGVTAATLPAPSAGAIRPETRYGYSTLVAYYKNSSGQIVAGGSHNLLTSVSQCQTLASCTNALDEVKTTIGYGPQVAGMRNNLSPVSVTSGAGNGSLAATVAFTYDDIANRLTVDGPLTGPADTSATRYDVMRRVVGQISPDPDGGGSLKMRAIRTTYNADGTASKVERGTVTAQTDPAWAAFAPLETVDIGYSSSGRPLTWKLSGGAVATMTQVSYDSLGRPECNAVRMNTSVYGSLPSSACILTTQGSFGPDRISQTVYDAASRVTQLKVAVGTTDAATEATFTYTSNGKLQTLKDAENNLTTYEYDGHDRLSKRRYPVTTKGANSSSITDFEQWTYDANGNATAFRTRANETLDFTYDALNRLTWKSGVPVTDVDYAYDNLGRLVTVAYTGNGQGTTNGYDALGRVISSSSNMGGIVRATSNEYDLAGRRTRLTYPGAGLYVNYDYLVTGEMTKIRENGATSGVGVLATFAYDNLGRRISLTRGNTAVTNYAYDPVSRLSSLTQNLTGSANDLTITVATYNPAGQIVSQTRSNNSYAWTGHGSGSTASVANGLNQLSSIGGTATVHDARGNLTTDPTTGKTYGYNAENLLTSASGGVTLSYDPAMRLYQVTGGTTTRFAYDGLAVIAEYNGSDVIQRRYVHGPGVDEPLVQYEGSGTSDRRWLHADERGSIVASSDASGNMLSINRYDEYGRPQSTNSGRFQYTGQMWLSDLSAYYYKARIYSPTFGGRFLQTDPIGPAGGINLYAYVRNDPVNLIDPLGLSCVPTARQPCIQPVDVVVTGDRCRVIACGPDFGMLDLIAGIDWGPYSYFTDFPAAGGIGPEGSKEEKPKSKQLSACMIRFLASQGLGAPNLSSIKFVEGSQGNAAAQTAHSRGHSAIAIGNTIYVQSGSWSGKTSPRGGATYFEEIIHSIQWDQSGSGDFLFAWAIGSAAGALFTGDAHNSPLEAQAMGMSQDLLAAYRKGGSLCPD